MMIYTLTLKHGGLVDFQGYTVHSTQFVFNGKELCFRQMKKSTPIHHSPCFTRNPKDFTLIWPFQKTATKNPNKKTFPESFPFS